MAIEKRLHTKTWLNTIIKRNKGPEPFEEIWSYNKSSTISCERTRYWVGVRVHSLFEQGTHLWLVGWREHPDCCPPSQNNSHRQCGLPPHSYLCSKYFMKNRQQTSHLIIEQQWQHDPNNLSWEAIIFTIIWRVSYHLAAVYRTGHRPDLLR